MCYIVFISRIQRPLRPASVFSMMMMMMMMYSFHILTSAGKELKCLLNFPSLFPIKYALRYFYALIR